MIARIMSSKRRVIMVTSIERGSPSGGTAPAIPASGESGGYAAVGIEGKLAGDDLKNFGEWDAIASVSGPSHGAQGKRTPNDRTNAAPNKSGPATADEDDDRAKVR
jgi:hypothetical protein